ncbi:MAG: hypothetical protein DYG89_18070 [Caldilinea sp. CFX5]|nr:hypothetical protein [Caldilinea sp. CFX5]
MYLLDTDHATLYQQGHAELGRRLAQLPPNQLTTSVITYDEQVSGRLAVVHKARNHQERIHAYYLVATDTSVFLPNAGAAF